MRLSVLVSSFHFSTETKCLKIGGGESLLMHINVYVYFGFFV